ncbi:preprotein translocase subunit SecG [Chelativorans sp. YIM 93263]|uniref:preprotein translocase subunit SecG n=1 Tax=Chelativorans sp. YIM 93263 TaxID=2906648 RepID=UPI0023786DB1|nr:preprotein translocase subunit SecG [Chelativorans sp. YIM 93263]
MQTIVIVIHLLVVVSLVGLILLQRSEGGGLGIGGGGSGFMAARSSSNPLTRATAILAAAFFATSLALSLLARYQAQPTDIFDNLPQSQTQEDGGGGILDELGGTPSTPADDDGAQAPSGAGDAPAAPTPLGQPTDPETQVPTGQ